MRRRFQSISPGLRGLPIIPAVLFGGMLPVLAVALTLADGTAIATSSDRLLASFAFNAILFGLLACSGTHLLKRSSFLLLYAIVATYLSLYVSFYVYHFNIFGQIFGESSINAVLDSNPQEAGEFLSWALRLEHLPLPLMAGLIVAAVLAVRAPTAPAIRSRRAGLATLAAALLMLPLAAVKTNVILYNPIFFPAHATYKAFANRAAVAEIQSKIDTIQIGSVDGPEEKAVTHILIIGESTTRRHMSLYDYVRDTTPRLRRLAPELEVATDVCSSRGATVPALQEMLTFATRENPAPLFEKPSLLQIIKAAGFRSWWLSNHAFYGDFDNWSMVLSRPADLRHFVNRVGEGTSFDEQLLPHLKDALSDPSPRKFIVLHLLGAHSDYTLRYPAGFDKFTGAPLPPTPRTLTTRDARFFNAYDNAILYNDHIVGEIIAAAQAADKHATVTFVSDHGEALGEISDFFTHIDGRAPRQVYEIPLAFWMSPAFRASATPRIGRLRGNLGKPFQTDAMIHTLLDLYDIRHDAHAPHRSLFAADYSVPSRFCDKMPGLPAPVTNPRMVVAQ